MGLREREWQLRGGEEDRADSVRLDGDGSQCGGVGEPADDRAGECERLRGLCWRDAGSDWHPVDGCGPGDCAVERSRRSGAFVDERDGERGERLVRGDQRVDDCGDERRGRGEQGCGGWHGGRLRKDGDRDGSDSVESGDQPGCGG